MLLLNDVMVRHFLSKYRFDTLSFIFVGDSSSDAVYFCDSYFVHVKVTYQSQFCSIRK